MIIAIRQTLSAYFLQARRHLETMVANLGAPFMFLTFSLSTDNPELFMFIDQRRFPAPEKVETLTEEERAAILNAHPVDAAEFYFIRMKAIIHTFAQMQSHLVKE